LLADDCGLGKTIQAIGIAMYYFDDWPLLIVCPASVKFQWREALLKWVPSLREDDIFEIDSRRKSNANGSNSKLVVITSYDSVSKTESHIKNPKFVILDESHMVKNDKTVRYRNVSSVVSNANRLVLISGTPAMARPIELYTQLKLLMPNTFSDWYIHRYCAPKEAIWGLDTTGCSNADELKVVLESTVMIRRKKDDVLNELPDKRRMRIKLDCTLESIDQVLMNNCVDGDDDKKISENDKNFLQAYNRTAEIKLEPTIKYLETVLEKGFKFLFFAHHKSMLDGVCDFLSSKKIKSVKIDGATPTNERSKSCESFQKDDNCRAAILSITAAGVGKR